MLSARLRFVGGRSSTGDANVLAAASCEAWPRRSWEVGRFVQAQAADAKQKVQQVKLMGISAGLKTCLALTRRGVCIGGFIGYPWIYVWSFESDGISASQFLHIPGVYSTHNCTFSSWRLGGMDTIVNIAGSHWRGKGIQITISNACQLHASS